MVDTETLILFIVIGIISSIFGMGRKGNGQSNMTKSIEEMRRRINDQVENFQSPKKFSLVQPEIKETPEKKIREVKYRQVKPITENLVIPTAIYTEVSTVPQQIEKEPELTVTNEVDKTNVINGIIWSEILGEPRARKPYYQRKS